MFSACRLDVLGFLNSGNPRGVFDSGNCRCFRTIPCRKCRSLSAPVVFTARTIRINYVSIEHVVQSKSNGTTSGLRFYVDNIVARRFAFENLSINDNHESYRVRGSNVLFRRLLIRITVGINGLFGHANADTLAIYRRVFKT